jgi:hypothetical protein
LENATGASPEIILAPPSEATSPAKRFMVFLMRASGSACGPVRADDRKTPEYGRACLIYFALLFVARRLLFVAIDTGLLLAAAAVAT